MTEMSIINIGLAVISTGMVLFHVTLSQYVLLDVNAIRVLHLGFSLVIVFLTLSLATDKYRISKVLMALACLGSIIYVMIFFEELQISGMHGSSTVTLFAGVLLIIFVLEATRERLGMVLPIFALLCITYLFLGRYLPGKLHVMSLNVNEIIEILSVGFAETGIFGPLVGVSATMIFLFMVFAALVVRSGVATFFEELGKLVTHIPWIRGGPAIVTLITSGLMGMISGQTGSIVAVTGSFTIPAMKRAGYSPVQAGAIEAAASTGGPITPPVMGIAAFLMSGMTGIPYSKIIGVAVLPAILYFFSCGTYVHLLATKINIMPKTEEVNYRELLLGAIFFLIPVFVLIYLFTIGRSVMNTTFWAVVSVFILTFLRKKTCLSSKQLLVVVKQAALLGSEVAVTCATLDILLTILTKTGLALLLPSYLTELAGSNILLILLLAGLASIILGMGLPASACYILVAVTAAPMLIHIGVPILAAHFFVFFAGNFSFLTPPVALAALYASRLAGSDYIKTGVESTKVGIAGFIIPFSFVFIPAFSWIFSDITFSATGIIATIIIIIGLQMAAVGYGFLKLNVAERVLFASTSIPFLFYIYNRTPFWFFAGLILFSMMIIEQRTKKVRLNK
jgi:TRAP transporter 4TM/12TM fusion protein